jgi:lipid II:glycine glycyltransferase (peptidoglycan interpeptide bridge formation enzyme)
MWKGFKDKWATILVDVTQPEETLLANMDKSRRKNINRAKENGLIFSEATDWEDWHNIYSKVWVDSGLNPKSIAELKRSNFRLFIAKAKDKVLGGGLFEEVGNKIRFDAYASDITFQHLRVNDFLYWSSILWAKANGKKHADLGGWQINASGHLAGVNSFKEKWGGEITYYPYYSYNLFYILGRKLVRKSATIKWIIDRLKGRPIPKSVTKE